jgi:hypothetical protein
MPDPKPVLNACNVEWLRKIATSAYEAMLVIEEWLGNASTRQAAMDALWRLHKRFQQIGLNQGYRLGQNWSPLDWRGCMGKALSDVGFGLSDEAPPQIRQLVSTWDASGRTLGEVLAFDATSFEAYWLALEGTDADHSGLVDPRLPWEAKTVSELRPFQVARLKEAVRYAYLAGRASALKAEN